MLCFVRNECLHSILDSQDCRPGRGAPAEWTPQLPGYVRDGWDPPPPRPRAGVLDWTGLQVH